MAEWTYYPSEKHGDDFGISDDRYKSFQMVAGVAIYGGFEGNETSVDERDVDDHGTALCGDV